MDSNTLFERSHVFLRFRAGPKVLETPLLLEVLGGLRHVDIAVLAEDDGEAVLRMLATQ